MRKGRVLEIDRLNQMAAQFGGNFDTLQGRARRHIVELMQIDVMAVVARQ